MPVLFWSARGESIAGVYVNSSPRRLAVGAAVSASKMFANTNDPGTSKPAMVRTVEVEVAVNDCVESSDEEGVETCAGILVRSSSTCVAAAGVAKASAAEAASKVTLRIESPVRGGERRPNR